MIEGQNFIQKAILNEEKNLHLPNAFMGDQNFSDIRESYR